MPWPGRHRLRIVESRPAASKARYRHPPDVSIRELARVVTVDSRRSRIATLWLDSPEIASEITA